MVFDINLKKYIRKKNKIFIYKINKNLALNIFIYFIIF